MYMVHFHPWFWECPFDMACLWIWIRFNIVTSKLQSIVWKQCLLHHNHQMSWGFWTITRSKVKMFLLCPSHLTMTSSLNSHPFVFQLAILNKCKAWTTNMMVMLGAKWRPPTSRIVLVWDLEATNAWGTYVALTILASISFALLCAKSKLD